MVLDAFDECFDIIKKAEAGIIQPSLYFKNHNTGEQLSLNRRMRFGMGNYMAITGPSGTGKTALADTEFVLNPLLDYLQSTVPGQYARPYYVYRSMERLPVDKIGKWLAYIVFLGNNSNLLDVPTLFQYPNKKRKTNKVDIDIFHSYRDVFVELGKHIDLVAGTNTPEALYKYMLYVLYKRGAYITSDMDYVYVNGVKQDKKFDMIDEAKRPYTTLRFEKKNITLKVPQNFNRYYPFNPNELIINVNDTVNMIAGKNALDTLNAHGFNQALLRDHKACACLDIIQFSRETEKEFRSKGGTSNPMHVIQADIKGTGNIPNSADILLAILDPSYFNVKQWGGHPTGDWPPIDIDRFHGTFRLLQLIKNSYGETGFKMPTVFLGETGYFHEIPSPKSITEKDYIDINEKIINNRYRVPEHHKQGDLFKDQTLPF